MQELSKLTSKYSDNVLDATNAWSKHVTDESLLSGLPESARSLAHQQAEQRELDGWVFTLEFPSYFPVMTYSDNMALREDMYTAYVTRASDQGPHAGQFVRVGRHIERDRYARTGGPGLPLRKLQISDNPLRCRVGPLVQERVRKTGHRDARQQADDDQDHHQFDQAESPSSI